MDIPAGEYEGPLRIDYPCTVNGNGATLWTKKGTALIVEADNVSLKDLRIEITDHPESTVALKLRNDTSTANVEVYGQEERDGSQSTWALPRILDFGAFAAEKNNEFHRMIALDTPCEITNHVHGISISPQKLLPGKNDVTFSIASLMNGTILYGDILLKTIDGISKRIYVTGRAMQGAAEKHEQRAEARQEAAEEQRPSINLSGSNTVSKNHLVVKGQRIPLAGAKKLFVGFQGEHIKGDIDPYAFQLYENGKTRQDKDLIFFGNPQSENNGVCIDHKDGMQGVSIHLENVPEEVKNIVAAFAVYEEDGKSSMYFSTVRNPLGKLYIDEKIYDFPLKLGLEKVINMLEIYRYKGEWRVKLVGAGFGDGLKRLCEQYGIDVM